MSLARHLWNAFLETAKVVGSLEGNDGSNIESTVAGPTEPICSSAPRSKPEQACTSDREQSGGAAPTEPKHPDAIQYPQSKANSSEGVNTSNVTEPQSNDHTELSGRNEELEQESSEVVLENASKNTLLHRINEEFSDQNQKLLQANARHLKWQDKASMTIKGLIEWAQARKHETRATKNAAVRARAALRQQIGTLERQIKDSKLETVRMTNENARTMEEHENHWQEVNTDLEAQKQTAERAAAAAERQLEEAQAKHEKEMSTARSKIEGLRATQTFTIGCERDIENLPEELSQAQKEKGEVLAPYEKAVETPKKRVDDHDSEIFRLRGQMLDERQAKRRAIEEKDKLHLASLKATRDMEILNDKYQELESEKREATSRALSAEGRAKGLQDQLWVSEKNADRWEALYQKTEEDARDKVLSAYADSIPPFSEDGQHVTTKTTEEVEILALVETLRKEKEELQEKNDGLTADVSQWSQRWEAAVEGQETWQQDIRRQCDKEKEEALAQARANDRAISERDTKEHDIRRQCKAEKEKALAEEREKLQILWDSRECSLKGQFAVKLRSHTNQELQKARRRTGSERNKQSKVKRCQVKCVLKQAVSRAVEVEWPLIQNDLRSQVQTELFSYKAQFEAEHAKALTELRAQNDTGSMNQVLLDQEIKKRDGYIESHKARLKQAYDEKRKSEAELKRAREENDRLSQQVIAHDSEEAMARQSGSEAQISLMTQDLVRASKLLAELAAMGLDQYHRDLLNELVLANQLIRDTRLTIEEDESVDYEDLKARLQRVVDSSDGLDDMDPRERPTLYAQLCETYLIVGGLINILAEEPGATTNQDILERIYRDKVKGKGKEGTPFAPNVISGPSVRSNGGRSAAPSPEPERSKPITSPPNGNQETDFGNNSAQNPDVYRSTDTPDPHIAESEDEPEEMDSATAHALQRYDEMDPDMPAFDLDSIDWDDPAWLQLDPEAGLYSQ